MKEIVAAKKKAHPLVKKLAYASTDGAGNLLFCIISSYILYFYTDVYGLTVGAAGILLLIARIVDSFDAPFWGSVIDHTKSKYGQSRPWFLWLAIPFAIATVLAFSTPNLSGSAKVVYAGITYVIAGTIYSGIATPITSILPNLSNDPDERIHLNSFRMVGGNIGNFAAVTFALPLVALFGGGDDRKGFSLMVAFFGVIAVGLLFFAFFNLEEINTKKAVSIPFKDSLKAVKGNWPWILLVLANLAFWMALTVRTSALLYYFEYNLGSKNLVPLINGISLIQVGGMMAIPFISKRLKKTGTMIVGLGLAVVGQFLLFLSGTSMTFLVISWAIACIGSGIACSMPFAMLSDAVDFGEWKSGIRSSGFLSAMGSSFCIKVGAGLGSYFLSVIMAKTDYVANQVQTSQALAGIQFVFLWLPAILFALSAVPMLRYYRYEKQEGVIRAELLTRREQSEQ
ncbi:MFS transporter [Candidatus Enterococcus ferrettii]|uniref:MFS transporter n=1 Tax=Candidatus Enterococcus ferrettii TaxID=2815324 RepID=A0ABV0EMZ2_9ENTE|nr:MFS transporter [Enterococcus sp. 665A]MBO1339616.1 MFS transporter [Enterococcus sp. 665A]